jgi:glyoxylase-like metal-dependent hydrolase (beta-lactamase superfamily II)
MRLRASIVTWAAVLMAFSGAISSRQTPDFSKVEIVTTKIADSFYALEGQGGRIGVLTGPDGIFMVDSQFAPLTEKIVAAIRQLSDRPIRFLVDTHVHGDHTGGNENLGRMGVTIFARTNLRKRLLNPNPPASGGTPPPPAPAVALPVVTYDGRVTLHLNGETVELIPLPLAHTDGDTAVRLTRANVLMTGDVFRSTGYPNIDRRNGGTLNGILEAFNALIDLTGPATRVLPGHGPVTDRAAIVAHRDMALAVRDRVTRLIQEGKSVEEAVAAKPTADYDERTGNAAQSADRFVSQVYEELKAMVVKGSDH